jgi:hypothetical protein
VFLGLSDVGVNGPRPRPAPALSGHPCGDEGSATCSSMPARFSLMALGANVPHEPAAAKSLPGAPSQHPKHARRSLLDSEGPSARVVRPPSIDVECYLARRKALDDRHVSDVGHEVPDGAPPRRGVLEVLQSIRSVAIDVEDPKTCVRQQFEDSRRRSSVVGSG